MDKDKQQLYVFGYGLSLLIPFFIGLHQAKPYLEFWPFTFVLLGGFVVTLWVITQAARFKPAFNIWMVCVIDGVAITAFRQEAGVWTGMFTLLANGFLCITIINVQLLKPVYDGWMNIAHGIGAGITGIVLVLVYYTMFGLAGIVLRLLKKDILGLHPAADAQSFWIKRESKKFVKEDCLRQF